MTWKLCACLTGRDFPLFWHMTWENWGRILGPSGKTSASVCKPFFCHANAALNCSQEWAGKGLGRLKMEHGEGVGLPMLYQEWGGNGLGWFRKDQNELWKGVWVFHSWFPREGWEGFGGSSMRTSTTTSCWGVLGRGIYHMRWDLQGGNGRYRGRRGLGCPCFSRMGWEGLI